MTQFVRRLFKLQPDEAGLVIMLGVMLLGNSLAYEISGVFAVSGFLGAGEGASGILIVWFIDMVLIATAAAVYSLIIDRYNRLVLIRWMTYAFAMFYAVLRVLFIVGINERLNYALAFLVAEMHFFMFPLVFWVLANDILGIAKSKRLFPLIGSLSFVGKLLGILIAMVSPTVLPKINLQPQELLSFNVIIYLHLFIVVAVGLGHVRIRETNKSAESVRETFQEGWDFVRHVPIFRYLALSIIAMIAVETIIEFRFLEVTDIKYPDTGDYQRIYSQYRLTLILASILVQLFISSRVISRLGLNNTPFILPVFSTAGLIAMLAFPAKLGSSLTGILAVKTPLYTIDESARKGFQALIPEERRGRVSIFIDNYVYTFGAIVGLGIISLTIVLGNTFDFDSFYAYLGAGLVLSMLAIFAIIQMHRNYEVSLMNWRLKRRQRASSVLDKLDF